MLSQSTQPFSDKLISFQPISDQVTSCPPSNLQTGMVWPRVIQVFILFAILSSKRQKYRDFILNWQSCFHAILLANYSEVICQHGNLSSSGMQLNITYFYFIFKYQICANATVATCCIFICYPYGYFKPFVNYQFTKTFIQ